VSLSSIYSTLTAGLFEHQAIALRGLEQCRRRGFATRDLLIGDRIPDYTDRDWRVSVPGSGHGSGGGLGTGDPTGGGAGGSGFDDQHPLNPRGEGD
jgi:hypothetical protein